MIKFGINSPLLHKLFNQRGNSLHLWYWMCYCSFYNKLFQELIVKTDFLNLPFDLISLCMFLLISELSISRTDLN